MHYAGTHILTLCPRDVCGSAHKHGACTQTAFRKNKTICVSKGSEAQIRKAHTHTHTMLRREGKRKDNIKGPKGQRHNLKGSSLSFCKERKSRKKQRG